MASEAPRLFQPGCHTRHKVPTRWTTKVLVFISMFYLLGHTSGAVDPATELGAADSVKKGLDAKTDAKAVQTGLGEANKLGSTGEETGLRSEDLPRAHAHPDPARVYPSRPFVENVKSREPGQAPTVPGSAGQSRPQAEADGKQTDMSAPKDSSIPNDQDDVYAPLRGVNFDNDEAYDMFILDYRARLVEKMNKQGRNAENWLKELQVPGDCLQRIRDDWANIKSGAWSDYELANRGWFRGTLLRWLKFFFWRPKWKEEQLQLQFLKIRMAAASTGADHLRAVLELDLVRRKGLTLGKEDLKLIEHTANAGGDIEKLTQEKKQLIEELPKKTLMHRRLEKTADLIGHFSSLQKGEQDNLVLEAIEGLKVLDEKAAKRVGWTKEETKLVMALGKVKDKKKKIDRTLTEFQKALIRALVRRDRQDKARAPPEASGLKEDGVPLSNSNEEGREKTGSSRASSTSNPQQAPQEANVDKSTKTTGASEIHRDHNHPPAIRAKRDLLKRHHRTCPICSKSLSRI